MGATLFMTNIDEAEVVLKVWLEECNWLEYPGLTLAQVSALPHGAQMQVDLIAVAGRCNTLYHTIDQNPDIPNARETDYPYCYNNPPWCTELSRLPNAQVIVHTTGSNKQSQK